ncbi:MAG: hypothetical protein ACI9R3_005820 [Verrucomicrobiales bacterium]|jgi:hypothetical protein
MRAQAIGLGIVRKKCVAPTGRLYIKLECHAMPQSLARVTIHIVFSTKNRDRSLGDATSQKNDVPRRVSGTLHTPHNIAIDERYVWD